MSKGCGPWEDPVRMTALEPPPIVLLPPSEGKALGGTGRFRPGAGQFGRALGAFRREVIDEVARVTADPGVAVHLFSARGDLADRARAAAVALAAGHAASLPAWQRYTGVVWHNLGPATLPPEALARIYVPSAVLGATSAADPVPDYRLKFGVRLDGVGRLDRFWRAPLTDAVARAVSGARLVDLLPAEHAGALDWDRLRSHGPVVRVTFVAGTGSARRAVGHAAKATKGQVARMILQEGLEGLRRAGTNEWRVRPIGEDLEIHLTP